MKEKKRYFYVRYEIFSKLGVKIGMGLATGTNDFLSDDYNGHMSSLVKEDELFSILDLKEINEFEYLVFHKLDKSNNRKSK